MPAAKPDADAEALKLRIAGFSYEQIAARRGYRNRSGAFKAVERALEAGSVPDGALLEIQRLDVLQTGLFSKALQGDVQAALAVVKIIEQRAKLASPFQAPQAAAAPPEPVEVIDPVDDITARIARRRAAAGT